jgi:serralysin
MIKEETTMPTKPVLAGGDDGNNTLNGDSGDDILKGFGGADILNGGSGSDFLQGGKGADVLIGGEGLDTADYSFSTDSVVISLANNTATGGEAHGDSFSSIENITGSGFGDALAGNAERNVLQGGNGDDILTGLAGNDVIEGGTGADVMSGGGDDDTLSYASSQERVIVGLEKGDVMGGGAAGDTIPFYDFENIIGSAYSDLLAGNGANNTFKGGAGDDIMYGRNGEDWLLGGDGTDTLYGGNGNDELTGGGGKDFLHGGSGADRFAWDSTTEANLTAGSADRILDFNPTEGDRIDLLGVDANIYVGGNQAFTFIGTAAFSGTPGEVRYYHSGGNTFIEMQTGTSVDIEGVIRIDGMHTLQAGMFML